MEERSFREETEDIPKLEKTLSRDESAALARLFERTKMFVPTRFVRFALDLGGSNFVSSRAHPNAPDKPPFDSVVGLMTAPLDKLRDLFDKFPETK